MASRNYYISPSAISIVPNAYNRLPDYAIVNIVSGAKIRVTNRWQSDINGNVVQIGYSADLGYRTWGIEGGQYHLAADVRNDDVYIHLRIPRSGDGTIGITALAKWKIDIVGQYRESVAAPVSVVANASDYYFIHIATLSAPNSQGLRELSFLDTGELDTAQGNNNKDGGEWQEMFANGTNYIQVLKPFYSLSLFNSIGVAIKKFTKEVSNFVDWIADDTVPTTSSVAAWARSFMLRKDQDDSTEHTLTMNKAVANTAEFEEAEIVGAEITTENVTTSNITTANITTGNITQANAGNLNVTDDAKVGNILESQHIKALSTSELRTTTFGDYTKGLITGANTGAKIFETGHADFKSVAISEFLEVPELRFNRATVEIGITIRSKGGGVIEDVVPDKLADGTVLNSGFVFLKLEKGEVGAVALHDLNMGFWHNEGDGAGGVQGNVDENGNIIDKSMDEYGNSVETVDNHNGDYELAGFATVYFRVDEIPDEYYDKEQGKNVKNTMTKCFHYVLRSEGEWTKRHHPAVGMHFGQIGNTNNPERQALVITTTTYQLMLQNVNTWNYNSSNIVKIDGQLDDFTMESTHNGQVYKKEFHGNGTVLGNAYIYGGIDQFERAEIKLEITFDGDYMLAFGEEKMMSCVVTNGYGENITNQVTEWDISRDSGNVNDDKAWKNTNKVKEFLSGATGGTLILSYTKDDNDLGNSTSCLFSIVAKIGTQTAEASLSI